MEWFIILIILFVALIVAIKLLVFVLKESIKANAWAEAEIKVRKQADNFNLNTERTIRE